jgi:hypothetical protein
MNEVIQSAMSGVATHGRAVGRPRQSENGAREQPPGPDADAA